MSTLIGILVFAALFAAFGMLGTALARPNTDGRAGSTLAGPRRHPARS